MKLAIITPVFPHRQHHHRQLPGCRHRRFLLCTAASPGNQTLARTPQITRLPERPQQILRTTNQQSPQIRVATFPDPQLLVDLPGLIPLRNQPQIRSHIPRPAKTMRILDRQHKRQRRDRPDSTDRPEPPRFRVNLFAQQIDLLIQSGGFVSSSHRSPAATARSSRAAPAGPQPPASVRARFAKQLVFGEARRTPILFRVKRTAQPSGAR